MAVVSAWESGIYPSPPGKPKGPVSVLGSIDTGVGTTSDRGPDGSLLEAVAAAVPPPPPPQLTQAQLLEPYAVKTLHLTGPMEEFWRKVSVWKNVSVRDFLSNEWNVGLAFLALEDPERQDSIAD